MTSVTGHTQKREKPKMKKAENSAQCEFKHHGTIYRITTINENLIPGDLRELAEDAILSLRADLTNRDKNECANGAGNNNVTGDRFQRLEARVCRMEDEKAHIDGIKKLARRINVLDKDMASLQRRLDRVTPLNR